jgi:hypothetical protein
VIRRETISALLLLSACGGGRRPISLRGDAGPAVVAVEKRRQLTSEPVVSEVEPNDDRAHANELVEKRSVSGLLGSIRPSRSPDGKSLLDEDWFRYQVPDQADSDRRAPLRAARVEVTSTDGIPLNFEISDERGRRLVAVHDVAGGTEVVPDLALEPGQSYFLRVHEIGAGRDATRLPLGNGGAYNVIWTSREVRSGTLLEPNDDATHAVSVPLGVDLEGFYGKKHDEDWIKVALEQTAPGTTLRVEISPIDQVGPAVRVLIGNVTLAEARGIRGGELRLRNVGFPPGAEAAYVVVRAAEGKNTAESYSVRISSDARLDGAEREPNGTKANATPLPIEGVLSGFLWPNDTDWYCLPVGSGTKPVKAEGVDGIVLKLALFSRDGNLLSENELKSSALTTRFALPDGGCIRASGRPRDSTFEAPYHLMVGVDSE